jgi:hypothetical protein
VTTHQEKTMTSYSDQQLDAIMTAGEERPGAFKGLKMFEVAAKLAAEGHPLFKGQTFAAPAAAPAPTTAAEATGLDLPPARGTVTVTAPGSVTVVASGIAPDAPRKDAALPAKREQHAVAVASAPVATGLEGLEGLTQQDVKIPRLAIKQSVGGGEDAEKVPLGHVYLGFDPGGATPKRTIRVLDAQPARSFLMPYGKSAQALSAQAATRLQLFKAHGVTIPDEAQAACSSPDRKKPEDRGWGTLARSCDACPYSQWKTVGGKRVAPECGESYRLLVLDESTGTPAIFWARKTAIAAVKNLLTNLVIAGRRDKTPPAGYRIELDTVRESDGSNAWYVPRFGALQRTSADELEAGLALRRALMAHAAQLDEHAAEAAAQEAA